MPLIERSIFVQGDPGDVYELAKDFPAFVEHMPDVRSITVLERGENYAVTEWDVDVMGRSFRWTERDDFDDDARVIRFRQTAGELSRFEGEWRFEEAGDGVRVRLLVDFELGIPMLGALLNPVLAKAVEENTDKLLHALRERAERT